MRLLGPGSVSSFLKVVLDVIYIALWIALAALVFGGVALLVLQPFTGAIVHIDLGALAEGHPANLTGETPALVGLVFIIAAYVSVLVLVFNRLRRVFETLTAGDPFRPQNVGRLRVVGLGLIALEALGYTVHFAAALLLPGRVHNVGFTINLTGWFAILVVFVLAEVFGEGARLRQDAELTI